MWRTLLHTSSVWVVLFIMGISLSIAAVATNPALRPLPPYELLLPPYTAPEVAGIMPDDAEVTSTMGTTMVRILDRPPTTRLYNLNTELAQDVRESTIEQAWERRWRSPNTLTEVVVMVEVAASDPAIVPTIECESTEPLSVPGADIAGFRPRTEDLTAACALLTRGRLNMAVQVTDASGGDVGLVAALTTLVSEMEPRIVTPPSIPDGSFGMPRQQISMLRKELLGVFVLLLAVVGYPLARDRSLWRRLLTRWAPGRLNPLHLDVEIGRRRWSMHSMAIGVFRLALLLWALRGSPCLSNALGPLTGYSLVVVAYVVGLWVHRLLTPASGGRRRPLIRGMALIPAVLGLFGSLATLAGAGTLWVLGSALAEWGSGTAEFATWQMVSTGWAYMLGALIVALWVPTPVALGRRWAMAMMKNRRRGAGRPVLMLRTFGDDTLKLRVRRPDRAGFVDGLLLKRREGFEELVALMVARYGPPIAVGQPGQILPPGFGAQRFTFDDRTWQPAVREFAEEATLITVFIGQTAGLSWELELVASSGYLHKTIFLVPPVASAERDSRLAIFAASYDLPVELFETGTARRVPLAICWPLGTGQPIVVSAASADDISYEIAIRRCVAALSGELDTVPIAHRALALPQYRDLGLPAVRGKREWVSGRWWRPWTLNLAVTLAGAVFVPLLTGSPMGQDGPLVRAIDLGDGNAVTTTLGGEGDNGWAIRNWRTIINGDFGGGTLESVADLESPTATARRQGKSVYYIGSGFTGTPRQVAAVDLDTARHRWRLSLPELTEGLAATDTSVYVTQAGAQALWVIDAATGQLVEKVSLGCTPWGVSASGVEALVACPVEGRLVRVTDGVITTTEPIPPGTLHVVPAGTDLLAYVPARAQLVDLRAGDTVHLTTGEASFDVTPVALAVEGIDRISVFEAGAVERRNARADIIALGFFDDGTSVQYSSGSTWLQLIRE